MRRFALATLLYIFIMPVAAPCVFASLEDNVADALSINAETSGGGNEGILGNITGFASNFVNNVASSGWGGILKSAFSILSFLSPSTETFTQWASKSTLSEMVGKIVLKLLEYMSDWLGSANDLLFNKVFSLLTIYLDYSELPKIKAEVNSLYQSISKIAFILMGIVFAIALVSLAATSFSQENGARFASGLGILCGSVLVSVVLIIYFPRLLSGATVLTSGICNEIIGHKVQGENIDYSRAKNIVQQPTVANLVSGVGEQALNNLKTTVNDAVDTVAQNVSNNYIKPVQKKIDQVLTNPVGTAADALKVDSPIVNIFKPSNDKEIGAHVRDAAVVYILKIMIAIGSITLALSLLCLKGIQLVSIFIMLFFAPLVFIFIILPKGYSVAVRYCTALLGLLTWPIVWAIMIKVYFLIKVALSVVAASSVIGSANFANISDKALLMVFMELALLTMTLSVSAVAGYVFATASLGNIAHMGGILAAAPAIVGGFVGAGVGAATFGALASRHGIGGAIMRMSKHGKKLLPDSRGSGGGGQSLNAQRNTVNKLSSAVGAAVKPIQDMAASQSKRGGGNKLISTTDYNGQQLPQHNNHWDNYSKKKPNQDLCGICKQPRKECSC